jgi:hypothetical protein
MLTRLLLPLLFPLFLAAQSADLVARITTSPRDVEKRINAVVEVETRVPLQRPELITLDVLGSFVEQEITTSPGLSCQKKGDNWLHCDVMPMPAGSKASVSFRGVPWYSSGRQMVLANLEWREAGFRSEKRSWEHDVYDFAREIVVTHTGDEGPGSFRQALTDANTLCNTYDQPCRIRFDAGAPAVIRPLTPLPEIRAVSLTIDGESKVTLDGSLLTAGNGLAVAGIHTGVTVRGLAIQSFRGDGISISDGNPQTRVIGCSITGNGSRGVATSTLGSLEVEGSVLSGNGRSGIFALAGSGKLLRNLIGVAADGVTPMPNGASGIFANGYSWVIHDNVIAHNAHWGVATHANNRWVDLGRNRIIGNRLGAIDVGLDGPSFFARPTGGAFNYVPPNGPALLSAAYDPAADVTSVSGRLENVDFFYFLSYEIQFWLTPSANEADQYLGAIHITQPDFTVRFPGDLRGRLVTANTIRWLHDEITDRGPSELSAPSDIR